MDAWLWALLSIVFAPYVVFITSVIVLASIGKTFGIRKLYIDILLLVFEWGKQRIEKHDRIRSDSVDEDEEDMDAGDQRWVKLPNGTAGDDSDILLSTQGMRLTTQQSIENIRQGFDLSDSFYFCKKGLQSIVEDQVTQRFDAAELSSWNLLTRTNTRIQFISLRLTVLWWLGFVLRYLILFPFRAVLALFAIGLLIVGMTVVGFLPPGKFKRWCNYRVSITSLRVMSRAFSAVITFHNTENKPTGGGICVANHTSPIDMVSLGCDNCYAMVGQAQGGLMGLIQRAMARAEAHIWFQRSEAKDRMAVSSRLREHIEDPHKLPILIFPEGTCINNTSIMMFKKGSFEVGGTIYPVAIKYDPRFADPFWNSSKHSLSKHLLMILTSWALVCDVWYLPAEKLQPGEKSVEFANRIKAKIAAKGGLVDLEWDGGLKRSQPKANMKEQQQAEFSKLIKGE